MVKYQNLSIDSSPFLFEVKGLKTISYNLSSSYDNFTNGIVSEPLYLNFNCLDQYGNLAEIPYYKISLNFNKINIVHKVNS